MCDTDFWVSIFSLFCYIMKGYLSAVFYWLGLFDDRGNSPKLCE